MKLDKIKLGRNDPCPCGSGKKYKKCCLAGDDKPFNEIELRQSEERLKERVKNIMGDECTVLLGGHKIKMSEVILEIADNFIRVARTKSEYQKVIAFTCMAWNLSLMPDTEEQAEKVEEFLVSIDDIEVQQAARELIYFIIEEKNEYYPHVNRLIVDYEVIGDKNDFHLNIASIIPPGELQIPAHTFLAAS